MPILLVEVCEDVTQELQVRHSWLLLRYGRVGGSRGGRVPEDAS